MERRRNPAGNRAALPAVPLPLRNKGRHRTVLGLQPCMGRLGAPLQSIVLRVADCTLDLDLGLGLGLGLDLTLDENPSRCAAGGSLWHTVCMQYMRCPVWRAADYMAGFGNSNAYAYWFGRRNEDEQEVYHGGELRYVFNSARQV